MTNNFFVFYRSYDPNFLNFQEPITLENADPFLFENTSSYIYKEYTSILNFSSLYNNRIYPEFGNITLNLKTNYFVSESVNSLSTTIDLQNSRSLFYQNNELIYLEYTSQITLNESGSNNILIGLNYYVSDPTSSLSTTIDLQNSRSLFYENNDLIYLEYISQITASNESGSNNIILGSYYYSAENVSTGSFILLETSRSLYLEDFGEFLLE
jgi:hypothetical protein